MKITLSEIRRQRPTIEALILNSFECEIYLVELQTGDGRLRVCDDRGTPLVFRSQLDAKKPFKGLGITDTRLEQTSAYNEMIGLEQGNSEPLSVRLNNPDADLS